jgi:hypothetical protein
MQIRGGAGDRPSERPGPRPYVKMTRADVRAIHEAGRRARALEVFIRRSLLGKGRRMTLAAQRELEALKRDILLKYDVRL